MESNSRTFSSDHMIKTWMINETLTMESPQRPLDSSSLVWVTHIYIPNSQEHRVDKFWHFNFNNILPDKWFPVNEIINWCQNIFVSTYAF